MYWVLFVLFYVTSGRPMVQQYTMLPAGFIYMTPQNKTKSYAQPMPIDLCTTFIHSSNDVIFEVEFNCSNNVSYQNMYSGLNGCNGQPNQTFTVDLNGGNCSKMNGNVFNAAFYENTLCSGVPDVNVINVGYPWLPNVCMWNQTSSCVNGQPMVKYYNNSACTGDYTTITAGQCSVARGALSPNLKSVFVTATDNPCQ